MEKKDKVVQYQREGVLKLFKKHRIRFLEGCGHITGHGKARVELSGGDNLDLTWDSLILALGSRPLGLSAAPFDGKRILSSNDAFTLDDIPHSLLILGGGVIGCEFAFIFSSLGSEVTVVELMPRLLPLPSVDEDSSRVIQREMKKQKISFMLNASLDSVAYEQERCRANLSPASGSRNTQCGTIKDESIDVEKILVCIGREAHTANAGLERLGLEKDQKGWILTNDRMETNVPQVYAIGDLLGPSKVMLAHVATTEGLIAAENALGGNRRMSYENLPEAIFTTPEIAHVGLTETQAQEKGLPARAESVLFRNLGKAHVIGEIAGHAKVVWNTKNGSILGVHLVGPQATDLIAEATVAMNMGSTIEDLAGTVHAHPTLAEIMLEVSMKALGKALHG
jgi:dihydrolipoamide dehydrogenase